MKKPGMRDILLGALAVPLAGCSVLETEADRSYATSGHWQQPSAFTTADVRIITERKHPILHTDVVCTEPSPDVAKALTSTASLTGKGGDGAVTASLAAQAASAEALTELAGRSTALLGLRDSLFQACQAFANGSIGQDAYALVLSRYSQLMASLFIAEDVATAAGAQARATASLAAPAAPAGEADDTPDAAPKKAAGAAPAPGKAALPTVAEAGQLLPKLQFVSATATVPAAKPAAGAPSTKAAAASPSAPSAGGSDAVAVTLARINEDYMHQGPLSLLLVACIDSNDPSRVKAGANSFLAELCPQLDLAKIMELAAGEPALPPLALPGGSAGRTVTAPARTAHVASARVAAPPAARAASRGT